jgi:predicted enzyme related to lactoylglutathione lyase
MNFNYSKVFLAISTDNVQVLTDFYSQLLQKQPDIYRPDIYTEFELERLRVGIFKPKPEHQREFENLGSSMSLCIEVEDLEMAIATLTHLGYPPPGEIIEASHGREIYAYDPAKNRLILHQAK